METLKDIPRAVCNDETVSLTCPTGTIISIRVAKYGKPPEDGCPGVNTKETEESKNCKRPNAMQVRDLKNTKIHLLAISSDYGETKRVGNSFNSLCMFHSIA